MSLSSASSLVRGALFGKHLKTVFGREFFILLSLALSPVSLPLLFTMFLFSHIYAYALPARCGVALQKSVAAGSATWRRHAQSALHNANLTNSLAHIWHRGGGGVEGVANTCVALVQKRRRRGMMRG